MERKAKEGIFGYVFREDSYYQSAIDWSYKRFNHRIDKKTLIHTPGVIPSLSLIIRLFTREQEKILIQTPVYYPFSATIIQNNRVVVENKLQKRDDGYYEIDFIDFEKKIREEKIKWFVLCSPHNPVGRVWREEELQKMAEICVKYQVRIISDEIWRDLVMPGYKHIPMASLGKEIEDLTITCFSATKTFNLAGLQASFVCFPRKEEWDIFDKELGVLDIKRNNPFSLVAFQSAYEKGEEWLSELIIHLDTNMNYAISYIQKNIPEIVVKKPEGTYLMWLDFSKLGLCKKELSLLMQEQGKIALDDGYWFGENGIGFERMNIACPRYMLEEGLKRIERAVKYWREEIKKEDKK